MESIDFCLESDPKNAILNTKNLVPMKYVKIPAKDNDLEKGRLTNFNKDCYEAKCNPQEKTMNISGVVEEDYTYEFDKLVAFLLNIINSIIYRNIFRRIKHY